jgi:hypothetical protein
VKDRNGEPERGEWMGADKNSSWKRWRLQQDEHSFQHTSPTHYPNWPSPRSHWSATEPRNQPSTSQTQEHRGTPTSSPLTNTGQTGPCWWDLTTSTERLHTGQTGLSLKAPKSPNRPTDLETDPNSKLLQHRTTANTPDVHPSINPIGVAPVRPVKSTGQTGVTWAARDEQHPWVNSSKTKPWSLESLHRLKHDFGDIRNTSWGVHSHD